MSDELRAAAERLRGLANIGSGNIADRNMLVFAYLAEHPADDNEPIDEAWLDERFKVWRRTGKKGWELLGVVILRETNAGYAPVFSHTGQGGCGAICKTRGDVRRLCLALGIELTEGGK